MTNFAIEEKELLVVNLVRPFQTSLLTILIQMQRTSLFLEHMTLTKTSISSGT
jgi:hypothetical protein